MNFTIWDVLRKCRESQALYTFPCGCRCFFIGLDVPLDHPDRWRLVLSPGGIVVEIVSAYVVVDRSRRGGLETDLAVPQEYYLLCALGEWNADLVYPCRHVKRPRGVAAYQVYLRG